MLPQQLPEVGTRMSAGRRLVQLSLGTLPSIVVTCCQRSPPRPLAFRVSEAISTLVTKVAEPLRGGTEGTAIRSLRTDAVPSSGLLEGASCLRAWPPRSTVTMTSSAMMAVGRGLLTELVMLGLYPPFHPQYCKIHIFNLGLFLSFKNYFIVFYLYGYFK